MSENKKRSDRVWFYFFIAMSIFVGICFILVLGIGGGLIFPVYWGLLTFTAGLVLAIGYFFVNRLLFRRMLAFILLCALLTLPFFVTFNVVSGQSTAQGLSTTKEENYFKNLLGRTYNYTELIDWENHHLIFYNKSDLQRNTDPIKIVEYGKGMCGEFATLYAELCISQGYRCRIVHLVFNDHDFNEVRLTNGTWIRVDASLNDTSPRAIGYPEFFEKEPTWTTPILALAFENSSITDVTSTYNSNKIPAIIWAFLIFLYAFSFYAIVKYLMKPKFGNPFESRDKS